ncbi:hypothetical protein [uncultured Prochlorococcus sp.]|uniref:hypothetical protein n=1 Tax=uncultured Prochlorococcus sp. TaxID=159733 RepID=UPI0025828034|nr:hypothetical protein [uncultured Prochlorococcus sp.]
MKSKIKKISSAFIATATLLSFGNFSPVLASCENAPSAGSKFKLTGPDSFKLRTTVQTFIATKSARRLNFILQRTDRQTQSELAEFFKQVFNGTINVEGEGNNEFLEGEQDMTEKDKLEGFQKAITKFNTEIKNFDLPGTRKVGQCVDPGRMIVVTREISSDAIFAASGAFSPTGDKTTDVIPANETINSDGNKGFKPYKSQVDGGYDGYLDMEEF